MREFATKLNINPDTEFIHWQDDCLAHGRQYIDWEAAWRTRCRNHLKFASGSSPRPIASVWRLPTPDEVRAQDARDAAERARKA
jgi:hypothetical protein